MTKDELRELYYKWLSSTDSRPVYVMRGSRRLKVLSVTLFNSRVLVDMGRGDEDNLHFTRIKMVKP